MVDTILIVDVNAITHKHVGQALREAAYHMVSAFSGQEALDYIDANPVSLVLMDLELPDMGGFLLLRRIHLIYGTAIIVLSADNHKDDRIRAFEEGADDFVSKPVLSLRELMMRIRAVLRRGRPSEISLSRIKIDLINKHVWHDGQEIILTKQRFRFLVALTSHPNRVFTRDELLHEVCYEDDICDYQLLYTIAYALRQLIEADPSDPQFIHSLRGVGYYWKDMEKS